MKLLDAYVERIVVLRIQIPKKRLTFDADADFGPDTTTESGPEEIPV